MIDYRILGPLEVSADGRPVEIGGPKLRALLGYRDGLGLRG
jgi:DNA-binding SARP family transcriptional activator